MHLISAHRPSHVSVEGIKTEANPGQYDLIGGWLNWLDCHMPNRLSRRSGLQGYAANANKREAAYQNGCE